MAKQSARKKAGLGPPPRRTPPPVRSAGTPTRPGNRRTWLIAAAGVAVLAIVGIVLGVTLSGGSSASTSNAAPIPWASIPGLQTGPPPWVSSSAVLSDRLPILGLDALGAEGEVIHIHQHLDIYLNGTKVTVPALVGIDTAGQFLTQLHTHDTTGILHVESPTKRSFRLGEFFGEWGVRLTSTCLGTYCGHLHWWVNGTKMTGNPAQLVLQSHQEIVLAVGKAPAHIPSSYKFPQGL